jgi:hypothetical protein
VTDKWKDKRKLEYQSVLGSEVEEVGVCIHKGTPQWKAWLSYLHDRKWFALHRHMMQKPPNGSLWVIREYP